MDGPEVSLTRALGAAAIAIALADLAPLTWPAGPARVAQPAAAPAAAWQTLDLDAYAPASRAAIGAALEAARRCNGCLARIGDLAIVLHAWDELEAAASAYAEARRLAPEDAQWWALSGLVASRRGRHAEAGSYFSAASRIAPSPLLTMREADARLDAGDLAAAEPLYRAAVKSKESEPAARYGLARIALSRGEIDAAWTELERAVELVPTFGAAHYSRALIARRRGDATQARREIELQQQCLTCWPMPADPWARRVAAARDDPMAELRRGLAAAGEARDAEAIAAHEKALAADPALHQARLNLISLYGRTGNTLRAEEHYRAALATGQQLADAHRNMGQVWLAAGDRPRAAALLALAIEVDPRDAVSLHALGSIAEADGRLTEALTLHERAVAADPVTRRYRFALARTLVALRRTTEALPHLERITTPVDAESATYLFAAAALYVRQGERVKGKAMAEDALARAKRYGLTELAASIGRDLERLK